jgi:uncharacterized membrane protein
MKYARELVTSTVIGGLFIVVPVYLALLLLVKGMKSVAGLVRPIAALLPEWIPAEGFFSLVLVLVVCFIVGAAVRTRAGRVVRERMEKAFFERLPGYGLLRSLTQRLANDGDETAWKPALVELEEALVPAFIIEELDDGRLTVFVPSVPTPFAGAVYILNRERVHALDVPFTQANPIRLALGLGIERPRGGDAKRLALSTSRALPAAGHNGAPADQVNLIHRA